MEINLDKKVTRFIREQSSSSKSKIARVLDLLESYGLLLGMPFSKKISRHLYELRIVGKIQIRFLYCYWQGEIHILHAFQKRTKKIPLKDLRYAGVKFNDLTDITNKLL